MLGVGDATLLVARLRDRDVELPGDTGLSWWWGGNGEWEEGGRIGVGDFGEVGSDGCGELKVLGVTCVCRGTLADTDLEADDETRFVHRTTARTDIMDRMS